VPTLRLAVAWRSAAAALVLAAVAAPAAGALVPAPVRATAVNESNPAAGWGADGSEYIAWTQNSAAYPRRYNAYIQRGTDPKIKLNTVGQGWIGGIDYPTVAYQQIYNGRSDLKLYDLATGIRSNPPTGANTARWEWHPTISGEWLLFNRDDNASPTQRVILFNRTTGAATLLASVTRAEHYLLANQVNGNFAVWTKCAPRCDVYKRDIAAGRTVRLPKPVTTPPRYQYGAAVTSGGTVYLARAGRTCGSGVRLIRYGAGDATYGTRVATFPPGVDTAIGYARENPDLSTDVFFDRVSCRTYKYDIYKIHDPPPAGP
jgi:hypothetical protein